MFIFINIKAFGILVALGNGHYWVLAILWPIINAFFVWMTPPGLPNSKYDLGAFDIPYFYSVFGITMIIIFAESADDNTTKMKLELTHSRIISQLIGIGIAVIATLFIQPHFAFHEGRRVVRQSFFIISRLLTILPETLSLLPMKGECSTKDSKARTSSSKYLVSSRLNIGVGDISSRICSGRGLKHDDDASDDTTILALSKICGQLEKMAIQLTRAKDASKSAEMYAHSFMCTELPIVGNDRQSVYWLVQAKVFINVLLIGTHALLRYTNELDESSEDEEQVAELITIYDACEKETMQLVRALQNLYSVMIEIFKISGDVVMIRSQTVFLYHMEKKVAKFAPRDSFWTDESVHTTDSVTLSTIDNLKFEAAKSVSTLLYELQDTVAAGRIKPSSLKMLNTIIVLTIVIRSYASKLLKVINK